MRVAIERGSGWAAETPTKLFGAGQYDFGDGEATGRTYDISRDGRRFLMIKDVARGPILRTDDPRRSELVRGAESARADKIREVP